MSVTITQLLAMCDPLHEFIEEMQDVCGSEEAWVNSPRPDMEQDTIMEKLFEMKVYASDTSVNSLSDAQVSAISENLDREKTRWSYWILAHMQILPFMRALDGHLRRYGEGGINTILRANDKRLGYWFQCAVGGSSGIGNWPVFPIDPENIFPPGFDTTVGVDFGTDHGAYWNELITGDGMGKWVTGAVPPAGTYTQGDLIPTTLYGKSNLLLRCNFGDNSTTSTFTIKCVKFDGTFVNEPVNLVMNFTTATYPIGVPDTDMYIGIDDITLNAGGVTGDVWHVVSELERFTKIT